MESYPLPVEPSSAQGPARVSERPCKRGMQCGWGSQVWVLHFQGCCLTINEVVAPGPG